MDKEQHVLSHNSGEDRALAATRSKGQGKLGLHTIPCLPQEFVSTSVSGTCALILREREALFSVPLGRSGGASFGVNPFE